MNQNTITAKLSQFTGIGARWKSKQPSPQPPPVNLPLGHPYLGLRNRWYLICATSELGEQPIARRILGEDLVLWRDGSGAPSMMRDYCPHRGARLSLGDVVDGELQCWYHFWRFNSAGQCTSIPTQGGTCSLQKRTAVESAYPVRDEAGFIWGWVGDEESAELELPDELTDPSFQVFSESVEWNTNWMLALENLADVMHAPFLHNASLTLSGGVVEDRVNVIESEGGFKVCRENQVGVNFDWVDFVTGPLMYTRLDIPYKASFAGPGPDLRIIGFATPIDDTHTMVHFPRCRQVEGWQRTLWSLLFRLRLRGTHLHVLNQDKVMLESLRSIPEAQRDEHLAQADKPVLYLRRSLRPEFDAQLAELGPQWEGTATLSGTKAAGDKSDRGSRIPESLRSVGTEVTVR